MGPTTLGVASPLPVATAASWGLIADVGSVSAAGGWPRMEPTTLCVASALLVVIARVLANAAAPTADESKSPRAPVSAADALRAPYALPCAPAMPGVWVAPM